MNSRSEEAYVSSRDPESKFADENIKSMIMMTLKRQRKENLIEIYTSHSSPKRVKDQQTGDTGTTGNYRENLVGVGSGKGNGDQRSCVDNGKRSGSLGTNFYEVQQAHDEPILIMESSEVSVREKEQSPSLLIDLEKDETNTSPRLPSKSNHKSDLSIPLMDDLSSCSSITSTESKQNANLTVTLDLEIASLKRLLLLKEREWNAILKALKLKEMALAQLRRRQTLNGVVGKVLEKAKIDFKHLLTLAQNEEAGSGPNELDVHNSIIRTENEIMKLKSEMWNNHIHSIIIDVLDKNDDNSKTGEEDVFKKVGATTSANSSVDSAKGTIINIEEKLAKQSDETVTFISDELELQRDQSVAGNSSPPTEEISQNPIKRNSKQTFASINMPTNILFTDVLANMTKLTNQVKVKPKNGISIGKQEGCKKFLARKGNQSGNALISQHLNNVNEPLSNPSSTQNVNVLTSELRAALSKTNGSTVSKILESSTQRPISIQNPLIPHCQSCGKIRAQFICAGCSKQWYCSRECQIAEWDSHSEVCSDY